MTVKDRLAHQLGTLMIANTELASLNEAKDTRIKELEDELARLKGKVDAEVLKDKP